MASQPPSQQQLQYRRVVVKVGSNVLTGGGEQLDGASMAALAEQITQLRMAGGEVILVTSGAITAGRMHIATATDRRFESRDVHTRQVLAAIGQSRVMSLWDALFEAHGVVVSQALLSRRDLADRLGYLNARNTLLALLDLDVLPIVNENDVVSIEEISDSTIGDNDNLSAQVANLVDAELLLMLTDRAGLYTADPARHSDAKLIETVERIDESIERAAAGEPGRHGRGGMATKVEAARLATRSGTRVVIADGAARDVIGRVASGEPLGTHFLPTGDRMESRSRYLLSGLQVRGRIVIDGGAVSALRRGGTSLLPAGVTACEGDFARGDVVRIYSVDGEHIANGAVDYSSAEVDRIRGLHSEQIVTTLGYEYGEEIVHCNNMVLV